MPDTIHRLRIVKDSQSVSPGDPADWQAAARSLRRIENSLYAYRTQAWPPRFRRAITMSMASAISLLALIWGASQFGMDYHAIPWMPARQVILLPVLLVLAVFIYFIRRDDIARTWGQHLDHRLAAHDPIDRDAYRKLQKTTAVLGYLNVDAVQDWTWAERDAIRALNGRDAAKAEKSRFLSRDV